MIKKLVTVGYANGLDARPIALLVQEASQYDCQVYIEMDEKKINAKSIMGMMSLRLDSGEKVMVVTDGADEDAAASGIETFLSNIK
ncbi:MAG: HPr family phosphocarrier protein [Lachnospiraceae bacterium]